jgi:hypothetical protein
MSDSRRLHMSFLRTLQPELADEDFRNLDTLAWAITGVLLQKTISLPAWVSVLPDDAEASAREQRFRRWLKNSKINVRHFYQPFIMRALTDWVDHTMYVGLDTTSIANRLVIAQTAAIYRGRAVPLAWQVYERKSVMLAFDQYADLVQYTAQLIPHGVTVIALGDRGFRDIRLMALLRQLQWHFRLRLAEDEHVWSNQHQSARLDSWKLLPFQPRFLQQVRLTQQQYGPVNLALAWDGDPDHDPWRIATDQPANLRTLTDYALRMGIEFGFLDDKSGGLQLDDTELLSPRRLDRLLLILALCRLYLVSLGTHIVATDQRRLVDSHWQRRLSYFQLGWRWLDYSLACDAPLPIIFYLDPAPDPEPVPTVLPEQFQIEKCANVKSVSP